MTVNTAGTTTFANTANVASLTTDAGGTTAINGAAITTTGGAQTYNDDVVLNAAANLTTLTGQNFLFDRHAQWRCRTVRIADDRRHGHDALRRPGRRWRSR